MNPDKLRKLEVVTEIVSRIETDLTQLKAWIKSQFEEPPTPENIAERSERIISYCNSSNDGLGQRSRRLETAHVPLIKRITRPGPRSRKILQRKFARSAPHVHHTNNDEDCNSDQDPLNPLENVKVEHMEEDPDQLQGPSSISTASNPQIHLKSFICKICSKGFRYKSDLHKHEEIHLPGLNYTCNFCNLQFKTQNSLRVHKHRIHQNPNGKAKRIRSPQVNQILRPPKNSNKSKEFTRNYTETCRICDQKFFGSNLYLDHLQRVHFICCSVGCEAQLGSKGELINHQKEVHPEMNFLLSISSDDETEGEERDFAQGNNNI